MPPASLTQKHPRCGNVSALPSQRCCWCSAAARLCTRAPAGSDAQPINHHQHLTNTPRPVAPRRRDLLDPVLVELLPEWLCGIASSAPLQTWSLHGDSSREKETASVGEGGGPRCCWLLKVIYSPADARLHRRDLL